QSQAGRETGRERRQASRRGCRGHRERHRQDGGRRRRDGRRKNQGGWRGRQARGEDRVGERSRRRDRLRPQREDVFHAAVQELVRAEGRQEWIVIATWADFGRRDTRQRQQ